MHGLVLTAGGARGAYHAGVLQRVSEIPRLRHRPSPFPIVVGASAGAISGSFVAAGSSDFGEAARALARLWGNLRFEDVVRADLPALACAGARWVHDLSLGGLVGGGHVRSLLDASPLRAFLRGSLPLAGIAGAIASGDLYAVAVSATSYHSGRSFTFIQGRTGHPSWTRARRVTVSTELTIDHVCASAAIPIVFPPVRVRTSETGECWFGDGALRLVAPLSPAIRLGAERILAIGIRCQSSAEALHRAELSADPPEPTIAQVCGIFLNALFLDHLDSDLDHLHRMNGLAGEGMLPASGQAFLRRVTPLAIYPSADLALVAGAFAHRMPRTLHYVMDGLGTPNAQSADLTSYLLFDSAYTRALIDIGYQDAKARIDEIESFLLADEIPAATADLRA